MIDARPITVYVTTEQWDKLDEYAVGKGLSIAEALLEKCELYDDRVRDLEHEYARAEAAEAERDAARLELAQERFMRASAEAEVARLRAELA